MDRLTPALQAQLQDALSHLPHPVTLKLFVQDGPTASHSCTDAVDLANEIASNSGGKVSVARHDVDSEPEVASQFAITRTPAIVVLGGEEGQTDYGIRLFGAPDGYEFATLVEDIRMASRGDVDLMPATRDVLAHLTQPLHIQVFVTPTCPYCPRAAVLAHSLAVASPHVVADVIDASEFPVLANYYRVRGVPRTVVNDRVEIEGALPESAFLAQLLPLFEEVGVPASLT